MRVRIALLGLAALAAPLLAAPAAADQESARAAAGASDAEPARAADGDADAEPARRALWAALAGAPEGEPAAVAAELAARIACRPGDLLALVAEPVLPADPAAGRDAARPLVEHERALVAALLDALGPAAVRAWILAEVAPDAPAPLRAAALRALAERATAGDLPRVLELASGVPDVWRARRGPTTPGAPISPEVAAASHEAAAAVLAADAAPAGGASGDWASGDWASADGAVGRGDAFRLLSGCFDRLPAELCVPLLRAAGRVPTAASARFLADRLWSDPGLDPLVLSQLERIAPELTAPVDEGIRLPVRAFLLFGEASQRRLATSTVGRLRDEDAVAELVELLAADDPGLRRNAHWALRRITGLGLRADPERWRLWHEGERRWWRERAADVLDQLEDPRSARVTAAINEIVQRRLHRHALAERLVDVLAHDAEPVVVLACRSLGQLGSAVAAPALRRLAESAADPVRAAAAAALAELPGAAPPPADPASPARAGPVPRPR